MTTKFGPFLFGLPIGATVGANVRNADPALLSHRRWAECTVHSSSTGGTNLANEDGAVVGYRVSLDEMWIPTGARWKRVDHAATHPNARGLWWWDHNGEAIRVATSLEVAFYSDGIVPASGWRLATPENEELHLPKPEIVWRAPLDVCSIEKQKPIKPKPVYKTADEKKLAHARAMLAKATTRVKRATTHETKWLRTVRRLERKTSQ